MYQLLLNSSHFRSLGIVQWSKTGYVLSDFLKKSCSPNYLGLVQKLAKNQQFLSYLLKMVTHLLKAMSHHLSDSTLCRQFSKIYSCDNEDFSSFYTLKLEGKNALLQHSKVFIKMLTWVNFDPSLGCSSEAAGIVQSLPSLEIPKLVLFVKLKKFFKVVIGILANIVISNTKCAWFFFYLFKNQNKKWGLEVWPPTKKRGLKNLNLFSFLEQKCAKWVGYPSKSFYSFWSYDLCIWPSHHILRTVHQIFLKFGTKLIFSWTKCSEWIF